MSFEDSLGKIALGIGCIVFAPVAVGLVAGVAATTGAVAVTAGFATQTAVLTAGVSAMGLTETSLLLAGTKGICTGAEEIFD